MPHGFYWRLAFRWFVPFSRLWRFLCSPRGVHPAVAFNEATYEPKCLCPRLVQRSGGIGRLTPRKRLVGSGPKYRDGLIFRVHCLNSPYPSRPEWCIDTRYVLGVPGCIYPSMSQTYLSMYKTYPEYERNHTRVGTESYSSVDKTIPSMNKPYPRVNETYPSMSKAYPSMN